MINYSDSKPSRKSTTALTFTFSNSSNPSQQFPKSPIDPKASPLLSTLPSQSKPVPAALDEAGFTKKLETFAEVFNKNLKIARKAKDLSEEKQDTEILNVLKENLFEQQTQIRLEIEDIVKDYQEKTSEIREKTEKENELIVEYEWKAKNLKDNIKEVKEYNAVLFELFSMELEDISFEPKCYVIVNSYFKYFIRYSLSDNEDTSLFTYRFINSNIEFPEKYNYLANNIDFKKKDLDTVYLSIMDSLYLSS